MTPRDYFAKGWPGDDAVVESVPMHTGATGQIAMFSFVNLVAESGAIVAEQAAAGATATADNLHVAVDDYDAYDVQAGGLLPVWTNTRGKIVVTPSVDTAGLSVGDELEVQGAGLLVVKGSNPSVGLCLEITADDEVRVLLY